MAFANSHDDYCRYNVVEGSSMIQHYKLSAPAFPLLSIYLPRDRLYPTFILNTVSIWSVLNATPRVKASAWAVLTVCLIARPFNSMAASAPKSKADGSELAMTRN